MSTQMEQGHYTEIDDDRFLVSMAVLVASRDADSVQKAANVAFDRVTSCPSRWMVMDRETDDATWISPEVPEAAAASPDMDVRAAALRTAAETPLACAVAAAEAATQAVHLLWRGMTSEEKAAWVLSAADAWPRHDIFLRRLLPVASQIVADEQVADSIRGARIEAAG